MSDNLFHSTLYFKSPPEALNAFNLIVDYLNKDGLTNYETKNGLLHYQTRTDTLSTGRVYKSQNFNIKFPIGRSEGYSFHISYEVNDRKISIGEDGRWDFELFLYNEEHSKKNLEKWVELMESWYDISNPFFSYTDFEIINGFKLRICTRGEGRYRIYDPTYLKIDGFNLINIFSDEFITKFGREKFQKVRNNAYKYKDLKKDGILIVPAPFFNPHPASYEPASLLDENNTN